MKDTKKMPAAICMVRESIESRKMVFNLAKNDFKTKYAGSYLGIIWAFVQPVVTILLYWFVFQVGFRSQPLGDYPFVLWLTAGLVPWFFFSDAWNGATNSMLEYSFLVKKVVFNIGILPVIKIFSAFFVNMFFTIFMVIVFALNGYMPTLHTLQLIYCLICIIALCWALSYFTSSIIIFIRDLGHLLGIVLQVLMWMTPIMWDVGIVRQSYPWLEKLLKLNPVYYIVQGYRDSMFASKWFWERPMWTIYFWGLVIILFVTGAYVFQKLRPHFADVL